MRRILTIDGVGVRGVILAVLLAALERSTGRLTRDSFDFDSWFRKGLPTWVDAV